MAGVHNFTWEQGTTIDEPVTWKIGSTPVNITGYTARMQIRPSLASSTMLHEFTTENDGIDVDGPNGTFTIKASATESAGWTSGSGWIQPSGQTSLAAVYDLEVISPTGVVKRLLKGTITLDQEVTR